MCTVHSVYTVSKVLADFAVCDWWRCCKALCDVKFSQIEGKGRQFSHIELSNGVISFKFLTVYTVNISPGKDVQTVAPTIRHIPWRLTVQHSTGIYPYTFFSLISWKVHHIFLRVLCISSLLKFFGISLLVFIIFIIFYILSFLTVYCRSMITFYQLFAENSCTPPLFRSVGIFLLYNTFVTIFKSYKLCYIEFWTVCLTMY